MAHRARTSMSDINFSDSNRDNGYSSGSARLLPSDDHTFRGSLEYKEPFQDEEPSAYRGNGQYSNKLPLYNNERSNMSFLKRNRRWLIPVGILLALPLLAYLLRPYTKFPTWSSQSSRPSKDLSASGFSGPRDTFSFLNGTQFTKPAEMKIIGIVFYGRRQFVNILECYLRRNLKVNGGMLDEIHFLMHTDDKEDKQWLRDLVKEDGLKEYYKLKAEDTSGDWNPWSSYQELYHSFMTDPDAIYIKMDDDLLFIDDYAIPELVRATLEHPEAHSIQANIVNNKWNYWHHLRSNAIWPYLADANNLAKWPEASWRPSELPRYQGKVPPKDNRFTEKYDPPSEGHRWLPLEPTFENIAHTPYGPYLPNPMFHVKKYSAGWAVTAQTHFSFFENHERRELMRYSYGNDHDHTWNQWYGRYNINMMAIRGSYVSKKPFWGDNYPGLDKGDEYLLTMVIPKDLDMPVLVATRAIAAHFSFRGDRKQMLKTDILDRYRALANEMYCKADNYKPRVGKKLGPHHLSNPKRPTTPDEDESHDEEDVGDGPQDLINPEEDDDDNPEDQGVQNPPPGPEFFHDPNHDKPAEPEVAVPPRSLLEAN